MWFKIFLRKWRLKRLIKSVKKESKSKANRKYCERLLEELSSDDFKNYQNHVWAIVPITTLFANIEEYTKQIKEASVIVKKERTITTTFLPSYHAEIPMTMDEFLTTNGGFYINVENAVLEFRKAALQLCSIMEPSDDATVGTYEHNFRMLTKLFINVQQLTETLLEISLLKNK